MLFFIITQQVTHILLTVIATQMIFLKIYNFFWLRKKFRML